MSEPKPVMIDSALLQEAESLGVEIENVLEAELRSRIERRKAARRWADENRGFVDSYNARIEREGLWHEHLRDS